MPKDVRVEVIILIIILVALTFSISLLNSRNLSITEKPSGELVKTPAGCYYKTVPGEFSVLSASALNTSLCTSSGDNYDPFAYGYITTEQGEHGDSCIDGQNLNEWACLNNTAVLTPGKCSLGCENDSCIKSKRLLTCEGQPV